MTFLKVIGPGALSLGLMLSTAAGFAQTATVQVPTNTTTTAAGFVIKEDLFAVSPVTDTQLDPNNVVAVKLRFSGQPNTEEAVNVDGITAEGYTRYVTVNGETIGQVVVTRLTKGEDFVDLQADKFNSQFPLASSSLSTTTTVSVDGDELEFVRAVDALNTDKASQDKEKQDTADTSSEGSNVNEGGGSNPVADSYETPERAAVEQKEEKDEPNITVTVSADGCSPIVDWAGGLVKEQTKVDTLEDGVVTDTEACSPSGVVWSIQKTYDTCEDIVDLDGLIANPQYEAYYVTDDGARYDLAACQADTSITYVIDEDAGACTPNLDFDAETVTVLAELSYRNRGGKKVIVQECGETETSFKMERNYGTCGDFVDLDRLTAQSQFIYSYTDATATRKLISECVADDDQTYQIVEKECGFTFDYDAGIATIKTSLIYDKDGVEVTVRDCEPSKAKDPIHMSADTASCPMKHDFAKGISTEMMMWTYEYEGQTLQANGCTTTDVTYTHKKVYDENGVDVCAPIVDMTKGLVVRQYLTEITVNGANVVIASCQPDEANSIGVQSTTDGCMDPALFDHDLEAGVSYGRERFYYVSPTAGTVYVSECQSGTQTYEHSIALAGWQNDDVKLEAWPLVDVSINVNGAAYYLAENYLEPGATATSYTFRKNVDTEQSDKSYYDGCDLMVPTVRTQEYLRPDGSLYSIAAGAGPTVNKGDKCTRSTETRTDEDWSLDITTIQGSAYYQDGNGSSHELANPSPSSQSWSFQGSGPYKVTDFKGKTYNFISCNYTTKDKNWNRVKITYPTGSVTYTDWAVSSYTTNPAVQCPH